MDKLKDKLPAYLTYHSWQHTEHVITMAEKIARHEEMSEYEILLIKTAALFHDFGFIKGNENHEEESIQYCSPRLAKFGYSTDEIEIIAGLIRATKIPQIAHNKLEEVLADADVEYLGTDMFIPIGNKLFQELKHYNPAFTADQWNQVQINFMQNHSYKTNYCIQNRRPKKKIHLASLLKEK